MKFQPGDHIEHINNPNISGRIYKQQTPTTYTVILKDGSGQLAHISMIRSKKMSRISCKKAREVMREAFEADESYYAGYRSNVATKLMDELGGRMKKQKTREDLADKILKLIFW